MTAEEIKQLRIKLGKTQVEMGRLVGVDALTVSRWERNKTRPNKWTRRALEKLIRDTGRTSTLK